MKVRPIKDLFRQYGPSKIAELSVKREYLVYAVESSRISVDYYVVDDIHRQDYAINLPMKYAAKLFEVVDNSVPDNWVTHKLGKLITRTVISSYPEWANDPGSYGHPGYYERLLNNISVDDPESKSLEEFRKKYDR